MAQSRLIELSYFDPHTSIRLTTYADTIVTDYSSPNRIISAVRFGGYPNCRIPGAELSGEGSKAQVSAEHLHQKENARTDRCNSL